MINEQNSSLDFSIQPTVESEWQWKPQTSKRWSVSRILCSVCKGKGKIVGPKIMQSYWQHSSLCPPRIYFTRSALECSKCNGLGYVRN